MRKSIIMFFVFILFFVCARYTQADGISDYLVLQDIGLYKLDTPQSVFEGEPPIGGPRTYDGSGVVAATGHFPDHSDVTYEVMYIGGNGFPSPTVQVTKHAGSDSDKWLLHEVERGFRDSRTLSAGMAESARIREINGNKIFFYGGGVVAYSWLSNNIVVNIQYTNLSGPKPEPLEVVKAYLAKHSSTITLTDSEAKSASHNEKWIKDEMDRRLWLGSKWMGQIKTAGDLDKLRTVVKNLNVFLDYREKYYGIEAATEKNALFRAQQSKDKATIETRLDEYYKWWNENKDKAINL